MNNTKQVFDRIKSRVAKAISSLPTHFGNEAVNFTKERFATQSWLDTSPQPWAPRSRNKRKNSGKALLVQSGRLKRSIAVISKSDKSVVFGSTGVPYAAIHNYGGTIQRHARSERFVRNRISRGMRKGKFKKGTTAGRGFTFGAGVINMPRRQFLGRSQALLIRLVRVGRLQIARSLKS